MALLLVLPIRCALWSAASGRLLRLLQLSLRPSALLRLSCSLHSLRVLGSQHAHNAGSLSRILCALWLLLFLSPSPQAPCLSDHMLQRLQASLMTIPWLSLPSGSSCHDQHALSSLH